MDAPSTSATRPTLSRRTLLNSAIGGLTGVSAATLLRAPLGAAARRVIVVGAGIAGIAAARTLTENGFDVVVLESRTRIGGRIWTDRSWGIPLDLGASWIHGAANPNPIWALRTENSLRTQPTDFYDMTFYDVDGEELSSGEVAADLATYRAFYRRARRWGRRHGNETSLEDGFDVATSGRTLSAYDRRALDFNINYEIEQDYGGAATELSNRWFDQDSWLGGRQDAFMVDGYDQLIDILTDGLDIRTGNRVVSVAYTGSGVTVRTLQNTFPAAYAVLTLPLGILQSGSVSFSPRLPRQKLDAIRALQMGTLNKLFLRYRTKFWDDTELFGYRANARGEWAVWFDMERITGEPVLLALNAATFGAAIEQRSNKQTVAEATDVLRIIYGNAAPAPEASIITRWNADPHTLGSYSHIPPGATGRDYRALSRPVADRLFWAGEATTSRYPQTVAGAYLSGIRAATQILRIS